MTTLIARANKTSTGTDEPVWSPLTVGPGANTLSSTTNDETLGNCTESNATVSLPTVSTTDDNKSPITAATKSTSLPATEVEAPTSAIVDKEVTGAAGATATEIAGTGAEASGTDQLAHPTTEQLEPLKDTWKENPHRSPRCNGTGSLIHLLLLIVAVAL
ncbi:Hypothetical predicted protein [Paramuricea clavata]|uniref:Uncharacterized protein n=1 Tax=Paramuricea clavata TaxID=317549 RepID=A0A6S7LP56_PARCT|nr:Hypothetical predicted protein [Paramuricea clavata]